jgi:hypothetical protein
VNRPPSEQLLLRPVNAARRAESARCLTLFRVDDLGCADSDQLIREVTLRRFFVSGRVDTRKPCASMDPLRLTSE